MSLFYCFVKHYTSLIYVKEKSFSLVNCSFPFVDSRGPVSCRKVTKIVHAYDGQLLYTFDFEINI